MISPKGLDQSQVLEDPREGLVFSPSRHFRMGGKEDWDGGGGAEDGTEAV